MSRVVFPPWVLQGATCIVLLIDRPPDVPFWLAAAAGVDRSGWPGVGDARGTLDRTAVTSSDVGRLVLEVGLQGGWSG